MSTQYQYLLQHTRAFLYHGDTDTMCNYIGGEWFADSLGREVSNIFTWKLSKGSRCFLINSCVATFVTKPQKSFYVTVILVYFYILCRMQIFSV